MNSISNEKVSLVDAIYMEQLNSCINVESALIDYFYKLEQMSHVDIGQNYSIIQYSKNIDTFIYLEFTKLMEEFNDNSFIQESVTGIIQKAKSLIKRAISWIISSLKRLYTKIFKRRQNKTADQVAKNIIQLHVNESSTSEFYNKKIILIKTKDAKGNLKSIPVTFFNKKTYIEIDGDGYTIHPKGIIGRSKTHNNLKVGSKLSTEVESDHVINFHEFVTNKHARDLVMNFLDKLNTDSPITYEMVDQFDEGITEIRTNAPLSPISCTPDELRQWISILNECQRKLMAKDPVYYDKSYSSEILQDALYRIKDLFTDITIGANILSSEIAGMFLVDAQYENTINDVETLSTFVGGMINAGIPSSYVGYNTWFVMSDKFDDKEVFINFDDESVLPRWGHTRIVFYPSDIFLKTKVMKIALNASGIAANKREMQISKNYKNIPYVLDDDRKVIDIIAKTEYISQNECITICERIIPEYNVDEANTLKATTVNIAKVLGHTLQITDVHGGNVGYIITPDDRKQWKILDYGGSLIRS